ncbi:MAG: L,D-transpeptidase family protein [Actinomycetota bacterium]
MDPSESQEETEQIEAVEAPEAAVDDAAEVSAPIEPVAELDHAELAPVEAVAQLDDAVEPDEAEADPEGETSELGEVEAAVVEGPVAEPTAAIVAPEVKVQTPPEIQVGQGHWWQWRPGRKGKIWAAIAVGLLTLGMAGVSYATYGFTHQYRGKILPGATIAGTDLGGMTASQAMKAVRQAVRPQLHRKITVTWHNRTWHVTAKQLGARSNARALVNQALEASRRASFIKRASMRVLGTGLGFDRPVAFRYPRHGVETFVHGLATTFDQEAQDASIDYSDNWVHVVHEQTGRTVKVQKAVTGFRRALRTNGDHVKLPVATVEPKVTTDAFKTVLLLHIGENKLYLYQNGKITHTYTVATGQSIYPTPQGTFHVIAKVEDPEWINPAPNGWGADMPASIPPGPDNPLGLRALYWSAPGIRFHGIPSSELSSLGHNASHGCIRMSNEDVMQLYPLVDIGTTIISVQTAPYS